MNKRWLTLSISAFTLILFQGCGTTQPQQVYPQQQAYPPSQAAYPAQQQGGAREAVHETADIVHTTTGMIRDIRSLNQRWY